MFHKKWLFLNTLAQICSAKDHCNKGKLSMFFLQTGKYVKKQVSVVISKSPIPWNQLMPLLVCLCLCIIVTCWQISTNFWRVIELKVTNFPHEEVCCDFGSVDDAPANQVEEDDRLFIQMIENLDLLNFPKFKGDKSSGFQNLDGNPFLGQYKVWRPT